MHRTLRPGIPKAPWPAVRRGWTHRSSCFAVSEAGTMWSINFRGMGLGVKNCHFENGSVCKHLCRLSSSTHLYSHVPMAHVIGATGDRQRGWSLGKLEAQRRDRGSAHLPRSCSQHEWKAPTGVPRGHLRHPFLSTAGNRRTSLPLWGKLHSHLLPPFL